MRLTQPERNPRMCKEEERELGPDTGFQPSQQYIVLTHHFRTFLTLYKPGGGLKTRSHARVRSQRFYVRLQQACSGTHRAGMRTNVTTGGGTLDSPCDEAHWPEATHPLTGDFRANESQRCAVLCGPGIKVPATVHPDKSKDRVTFASLSPVVRYLRRCCLGHLS